MPPGYSPARMIAARYYSAFPIEGAASAHAEAVQNRFPGVTAQPVDEGTLRVVSGASIELLPLLGFLSERNVTVTEARLVRPSLEEVFVSVTGIESGRMKQERESKKG